MDMLDRSELDESALMPSNAKETVQARSMLINEQSMEEIASPFTKRGLFTQTNRETESDLSVVFADVEALEEPVRTVKNVYHKQRV